MAPTVAVLTATLLALLAVVPLAAQLERASGEVPGDIDLAGDPVVLLLPVPATAGSHNALVESIVTDAMQFELQRQGVTVLNVDPTAVGGALPTDFADPALADAADQMGAAAGAGFVVAVVYELAGREVTLEPGWLNRLDGVVTAAGQRQGAIDIGFDWVLKIVDQFLRESASSLARFGQQAGPAGAGSSVATVEQPVGSAAAGGVSQTATPAIAGASGGTDAGQEGSGGAGSPTQVEPVAAQGGATTASGGIASNAEQPLVIPRQPLQIGTVVSALIPADIASTYFRLGAVPSLYLSWEYPLSGGVLGLGLAVPVHVFRASGLLAQAWGYITAAAAEARYAIAGPGGVIFYARLQAGPALFVLSPDFDAPAMKTASYVAAGGGGGFGLGKSWSLGLDVGYAAIWNTDEVDPDQSTVLGGLTAGLFVSVTF